MFWAWVIWLRRTPAVFPWTVRGRGGRVLAFRRCSPDRAAWSSASRLRLTAVSVTQTLVALHRRMSRSTRSPMLVPLCRGHGGRLDLGDLAASRPAKPRCRPKRVPGLRCWTRAGNRRDRLRRSRSGFSRGRFPGGVTAIVGRVTTPAPDAQRLASAAPGRPRRLSPMGSVGRSARQHNGPYGRQARRRRSEWAGPMALAA